MVRTMKPQEVVNIKRQSGQKRGMKNTPYDAMVLAMFPGKRISKTGKEYWETRINRSDISKERRL
jgi:hypothetical protein